jgi:uroporphyrinogen decarboxylase
MDIGEVKKRYGDRVAVWGNIDCSHLLPFGKPEDVRHATIDCIRKTSLGGGHIISSSNTIHSAVPAKNFIEMVKTTREYAVYPI